MAVFGDLPAELRLEILMHSALEVVVNLADPSQTTSAFRALVLSDLRILREAWYTHPFDLPPGTTPEKPPTNFLPLATQAVRVRERLIQPEITEALIPLRTSTHSLPSLLPDEGGFHNPRYPFVFGSIIVYAPTEPEGTIIIMDLQDENRRLEIRTWVIYALHCQIINNNSTLRIANIAFEGWYEILSIDDYDIAGAEIRHIEHLWDASVHHTMAFRLLTEDDFVLVKGETSLIIGKVSDASGYHLKFEGMTKLLRICVHPDKDSLILEYENEQDALIHFSIVPIPLDMPALFSEDEFDGSWNYDWEWPVKQVAIAPIFSYPTGSYGPGGSLSINMERPYEVHAIQPSSISGTLEVLQYSMSVETGLTRVKQLSISPTDWSTRSTIIESAVPPSNFIVLKVRGTQDRHSSHAVIMMVGSAAKDGLYILRTERCGGGVRWIYLSLPSSLEPWMATIQTRVWGFDMSLGRLFVHFEDKLHVIQY
ncbi:hypothetical protein SISNIDRAFT_460468 [Sistotremastrum niveocremeum HHB9708]|uniref:Uncharacterized protein n=1 Tax=Sistotremastrum niveocremeum HHB9708 TaxID=1314777 RepID=A0A164NMN5_9AGAM|nr:hypothetical protein SISNIDRAFT_460468 [Sistotremastrum niveocremeum HHB9708]